jgi:hypothetical protein
MSPIFRSFNNLGESRYNALKRLKKLKQKCFKEGPGLNKEVNVPAKALPCNTGQRIYKLILNKRVNPNFKLSKSTRKAAQLSASANQCKFLIFETFRVFKCIRKNVKSVTRLFVFVYVRKSLGETLVSMLQNFFYLSH